jgi:hypothetical protein
MKKVRNEDKKKKKSSEAKKVAKGDKIRRFPKFGAIDVAIILLIASIGVGIAFRYNFFNAFKSFQKSDECAISFSVKNIENTTQYYISSGDEVYFKDSGRKLGIIMESSDASSIPLTIAPSTQTFIENGSAITVTYPKDTRIDAIGRIKCEGKFSSDGAFLLNGVDYLSAGQTYVICTEKVTLEIMILGTELIEEK